MGPGAARWVHEGGALILIGQTVVPAGTAVCTLTAIPQHHRVSSASILKAYVASVFVLFSNMLDMTYKNFFQIFRKLFGKPPVMPDLMRQSTVENPPSCRTRSGIHCGKTLRHAGLDPASIVGCLNTVSPDGLRVKPAMTKLAPLMTGLASVIKVGACNRGWRL
jgi:hypothetical protein